MERRNGVGRGGKECLEGVDWVTIYTRVTRESVSFLFLTKAPVDSGRGSAPSVQCSRILLLTEEVT